jgi:hypothetical protein
VGRLDQVKLAVATAAMKRAAVKNMEYAINQAMARECINGVASATGTGFLARDQFANHCHNASSNSRFGGWMRIDAKADWNASQRL